MMMLGALLRLIRSTSPDSILARARAGDAAFFAEQYVALEAHAADHAGYPIVALRQTNPVGDLDADYALVILGTPTPTRMRVFLTEVGTNVMTGQPMRFLVEVDLANAVPGRIGNFGSIELPRAEFPAVAAALIVAVFAAAEIPGLVNLRDELAALIRLADATVPTASTLRAYFAPRALAIAVAGPNLDWPKWASRAHGRDDVYVDLAGDVIGVRLWDDDRGYGTSTELTVKNGVVADVENLTGPLAASPRNPGAMDRAETSVAFVKIRRCQDPLMISVTHEHDVVRQVTVHFPTV